MKLQDTPRSNLIYAIRHLLNEQSIEQYSNTPDWILAEYLVSCLDNLHVLTERREEWYGREAFQQRKEREVDAPR